MSVLNHGRGSHLAAALQQLIAAQAAFEPSDTLFMPSLMTLGRTLGCSAFEVHLALGELQGRGYRFLIPGPEAPITLWRKRAA